MQSMASRSTPQRRDLNKMLNDWAGANKIALVQVEMVTEKQDGSLEIDVRLMAGFDAVLVVNTHGMISVRRGEN